MATADKLNKLLETKAAIRNAIVNKGVEVGEDVVFADYPTKIAEIETGGGSGEVNPYYEELFNLRTSNGTNMKGLFYYCEAPELDLQYLDVSAVTNMAYMFSYCWSNVNCEGWDTSKVENISYMFDHFYGSIDLSKLDFSSVTKIDYMFNYAKIDGINLTGLNFPSAISFGYLFNNAEGNSLDLSSWDISNITNMTYMFGSAKFKKIDLTGWKTTNVTNMGNMFSSYSDNLVELIIPDWDMTNTTKYSSFFNSGSSYHKGLMLIDLSRSNDITITKIASTLPTRTTTTFGKVMIPYESSQDAINALAAKYWKPVGPRIDMTSTELTLELDEIKPGESTKLCYGNSEPWYGNDDNVEYVSSDESIATIDKETMTITSTGIEGTTEITARITNTQEVISVAPITLVVSETDNYPNVIKFRTTSVPNSSSFITVNDSQIKINTMNYNATSGIYTYDAGAPITYVSFSSLLSEIIKLNANNLTTMANTFYGCSKLTSLDLSDWDTSKVTNMCQMFEGCNSLTSLDLSSFDTRNVTNVNYMFRLCYDLEELDIRNFNLDKIIPTAGMTIGQLFQGCDKLHTIRLDNCNNDTISKIITSGLFPTNAIEGITRKIYCKKSEAAGLTAPTNWIFEYVAEEPEIPLYQPDMFRENRDIEEVSVMVTKEHDNLSEMFRECENLRTINGIKDWDTNNVTNMEKMFYNCRSLESLDLSSFDTCDVDNMWDMFSECENLKELNLSNFEISKECSTNYMLNNCRKLHTLHLKSCNEDTIKKIIESDSFPTGEAEDNWGETRKIYCLEKNVANLTAPDGWVFVDCETGKEIGGKLVNYEKGMFSENRDIEKVSVMVTEEHTDLSDMFQDCEKLTTINGIKDWNTSNVETMAGMFAGCKSLESLDLSNFDTVRVTNMTCMFFWCENLRELNLSNFDMRNISETWNTNMMFQECCKLHTLRLDNCSRETVERIIYSSDLPTGGAEDYEGTRKIYINRSLDSSIQPPDGWVFALVD